eukprot:6486892-Amphidinium_carterae.1
MSAERQEYNFHDFKLFTVAEVQQALSTGKSHRAPGRSGLVHELWRYAGRRMEVHLSILFNQMALTGDIVDEFAHAVVIPICKPSKPATSPASYRPISLLDVLGKTFERMLLHRLQAECRPIHHAHHGFASGLSCETAVAAMTHHIQQQMTSGTNTRVGILKLDLKSAFDQVVPTFLMQQLTSAGASFPLRQLLWTWLRRRRFT